MTALRVVWTVGAIAVDRAGFGIWQIAVPDLVGVFGHGETGDFAPAGRIEQAQIDPLGMGGEDGEIGSEAVPCGTERIRLAGQQIGGSGCAKRRVKRLVSDGQEEIARPTRFEPRCRGGVVEPACTAARQVPRPIGDRPGKQRVQGVDLRRHALVHRLNKRPLDGGQPPLLRPRHHKSEIAQAHRPRHRAQILLIWPRNSVKRATGHGAVERLSADPRHGRSRGPALPAARPIVVLRERYARRGQVARRASGTTRRIVKPAGFQSRAIDPPSWRLTVA